jgi:hypothetical protein
MLLFLALLAYETEDIGGKLKARQRGLWTWLVSGNWPAKVGAILLIVGLGALMRPAQAKLIAGCLVAAAFGYLSFLLRNNRRQRAMHLALAGAACGVAYLTAYSAYALFSYVDSISALTMLVVVAGATGIFAVTADAVSIALLAMVGAYAAPAFAISPGGPLLTYGYYACASLLSLAMVTVRGWRPLIHLSFLFTLAGGLFFGWTAQYYRPEYYATMQPMLLVLVALHLAMPILERRTSGTAWDSLFDTGYFVTLPLVAGALTFLIAPDLRPQAAAGLAGLGVLWTIAALALIRHRKEAAAHTVVAFLFFTAALLCEVKDLSLPLVGIFAMTVVLTASARLRPGGVIGSVAALLLVIFIGVWAIDSMFQDPLVGGWLNQWLAEHVAVVILVGWSAHVCRERRDGYTAVFSFIAVAIAVLTVLVELKRLHFDYFAELTHVGFVAITFFVFVSTRAVRQLSGTAMALLVCLYASAWWVGLDAATPAVYGFAVLDIVVLAVSAWRIAGSAPSADRLAVALLLAIPLSILPWAIRLYDARLVHTGYFISTCVTFGVLFSMVLGAWLHWADDGWNANSVPRLQRGIALALGWAVLFHIQRGFWPVLFELGALATLVFAAATQRRENELEKQGVIAVVCAALVFQAMLLRLLGPPGVLSVADVLHMHLPAVVSLIWAALGAGLAWWGGHRSSRQWWTIGSSLMAVAAAKLILLDFGSLGELGNIIALIAAGLVFLAVAWLVPMPPKAPVPVDDVPAEPVAAYGASGALPPPGRAEPEPPSDE